MRWFALLLVAVLAGCARFPSSASSDFTKRLVFTMQVDGAIRTGLEQGGNGLPYVYVIAIRLSTDPNPHSPRRFSCRRTASTRRLSSSTWIFHASS